MKSLFILMLFFGWCSVSAQTVADSLAGIYSETPANSKSNSEAGFYARSTYPFNDPSKISCDIKLTKNNYASLTTTYFVSNRMKYTEYGKWKLKGDTLIVTFSKSACNYIVPDSSLNNIRVFKKPMVHYYVWNKTSLVELLEKRTTTFSKKDLNL